MSAPTQNPAEQLQQAALALDTVQKALDCSLADVKERSQKADGKISAALLDHHQLVSYDLALSCAEVTGARFGLNYARRARAAAGGGAQAASFKWEMRKIAPRGSWGRHSTSQPCASTICCTTASPRPVPCFWVVK